MSHPLLLGREPLVWGLGFQKAPWMACFHALGIRSRVCLGYEMLSLGYWDLDLGIDIWGVGAKTLGYGGVWGGVGLLWMLSREGVKGIWDLEFSSWGVWDPHEVPWSSHTHASRSQNPADSDLGSSGERLGVVLGM